MNGVINIYKEKGYSSFHVVYMLRRLTGEQKVGHTGTLDPDVTGVLPVCIGKATKLVGQLTDTDKTYRCRMLLGKATDTQDLSGQVLREIPEEEVRRILLEHGEYSQNCLEYIRRVIRSFEGEIGQIPPMYSALKVNGAKLVNLARKGVEVERKPRKIRIYSIDETEVSDDLLHISFLIHCSRGTYVRTLCEDIGERLGIPACMEELVRTRAAGLDLNTAITLDQAKTFAEEGSLEQYIIPTDRFLGIYPAITVQEEAVRRLIYGNYLMPEDILKNCPWPDFENMESGDQKNRHQKTGSECVPSVYRVYDSTGRFYALYRYDAMADCYKCVKMFIDIES